MWLLVLLIFIATYSIIHIVCEWRDWDMHTIFRVTVVSFMIGSLYFINVLQLGKFICEPISISKFTPNKIARDTNNNYYIIENFDKVEIPSVKLKLDGETYIEITKYKQKNTILDWILFDFEEEVLYLNIDDDVELVY